MVDEKQMEPKKGEDRVVYIKRKTVDIYTYTCTYTYMKYINIYKNNRGVYYGDEYINHHSSTSVYTYFTAFDHVLFPVRLFRSVVLIFAQFFSVI